MFRQHEPDEEVVDTNGDVDERGRVVDDAPMLAVLDLLVVCVEPVDAEEAVEEAVLGLLVTDVTVLDLVVTGLAAELVVELFDGVEQKPVLGLVEANTG